MVGKTSLHITGRKHSLGGGNKTLFNLFEGQHDRDRLGGCKGNSGVRSRRGVKSKAQVVRDRTIFPDWSRKIGVLKNFWVENKTSKGGGKMTGTTDVPLEKGINCCGETENFYIGAGEMQQKGEKTVCIQQKEKGAKVITAHQTTSHGGEPTKTVAETRKRKGNKTSRN